jgi:hypothetical protein
MGQLIMKQFDIPLNTAVVTSTYVMQDELPILYVSHEDDDGESLWQFHCGNNDYSMEKMMLVGLGTVLATDSSLMELADLKKGYCANRKSPNAPWQIELDRD